jgi:hypothetical protein
MVCIWETSMRFGTGVMHVISWRCNGECFNKASPENVVIATGEQHSVREFIELSASYL